MSRRERARRIDRTRPQQPDTPDPTKGSPLAAGRVPAYALLPLRFFFGITFLYAGIDKLIDPTFFDASAPTSIVAQMAAFARDSPLSPLIKFAEPGAVPIGLLIALAEIAIGLGAVSGLAFRLAAAGGAAVSILFWLTASWGTQPYFYGPDLPYAVGWITLAIAGHGGILVPRRILAMGTPAAVDRFGRPASGDAAASPGRRVLLQTAVLGGLALMVASLAVPFGLLGREAPVADDTAANGSPDATDDAAATASGTPEPTSAPSPSSAVSGQASASAAPVASSTAASATATAKATATPARPANTPAIPPGATKVSTVSAVTKHGSASFTVPFNAPAPLPAGDPGIIVGLPDGSFVAYDAICTHEGCTVEWDKPDGVLFCPCHGAAFDAADNAAVLQGPARRPLASLPIVVDQATGAIYLKA
jgi:thiosulfate dehydrogenase [quinone] large subunit